MTENWTAPDQQREDVFRDPEVSDRWHMLSVYQQESAKKGHAELSQPSLPGLHGENSNNRSRRELA